MQLHPTANSELKRALKAHERIPTFIENMCKEIDKVQTLAIKRRKKKYDDHTIKSLVYDMTNIFISGIEQEARKRYESDAQKFLNQQKEQEQKDLDASATGKLSGEYKEIADEAGLIMTDERSDI